MLCTGVEIYCLFARGLPSRTQGLKAGTNADSFSQHLAGNGGKIVGERIQNAKLKTIHRDAVGKFVVELFLGDCHLRYTETSKGTRGHEMGMDGARQRAIVRNEVRSGSMHRNTGRHGWPP